MALQKTITLDNGVVVGYHVITNFLTDIKNNNQQFTLESFVDADTYNNNPAGFLDAFNFTMEGTNNTLDAAYTQILSYDKYNGATNV